MVSLEPVLLFSSAAALFEKDSLKYKINRVHKVAHINKYR